MTTTADYRPKANLIRRTLWGCAGGILLLPLIAMQFTDEVVWTASDFIFMGILILAVGGTYELTVRVTTSLAYRLAVGMTLATTFLLIWVNGAVGLIGSENEDINLLYGGVLLVGIIGSLLARFRAAGMVWALFAAAIVQVLVAVIALTTGWGIEGVEGELDFGNVFGVTLFFTGLWVISALLFRNANGPAEGSTGDQS